MNSRTNKITLKWVFTTLAILFVIGASQTYAATYTVTNLDDDGPGSLRYSITAANATPDDDSIDFAVNGTIILTTGQLTIENSGTLTINGPGADQLTVSGNNSSRVFYINMGATVEINALTIADGSALGGGYAGYGAGIYNDRATVAINDSVIRGNNGAFGGGIYQDSGATTVTASTVSGNSSTGSGGGIVFLGTSSGDTLEINSSSISGNSASSPMSAGGGGGIYFGVRGILRVNNSTISDNSAYFGGGIAWIPFTASVEIVNSTVSGNTSTTGAGIHIYSEDGTSPITITDSTIANNASTTGTFDAGGIRSGSYSASFVTMTLNNTAVSGNTAGSNPNDIFLETAATTLGGSNNIVSVNSGFVFSSGSDNQLGVDPLLGPLQDNGGPTFTHALLGGSPAIDAGNNSLIPAGLVTDQRGTGFARISNGTVDIGAFEVQTDDEDGDGVPDSADQCSGTTLPEAIPEFLKKNRFYADADGNFIDIDGTESGITVVDTGGCSGSQIIDAAGLGIGHTKFGITRSALEAWIASLP